MNNNARPYTHFIGVLVPEDLSLVLEDCRSYMRSRYGCISGQRTPLHVTIVPPFVLNPSYSTEDLSEVLNSIFFKEFTAHVESFGSFGERTLYARVIEDKSWDELRNTVFHSVSRVFPDTLKKDHRAFHPHITIANRDIPNGALYEALMRLNGVPLSEVFTVKKLTLFEFKNGRWEQVFN